MSCIVLVLTLLLAWPVASWAQPAQLINGNRTHAGATNYGVTTGTGSAYILTLNAAIPGYVNGSCYLMQAHVANTGPATLNVNNRGAQALKKKVGTAQVDLAANDIIAGQQVKACTDGTVMQTDLGSGAGGGASDFSELTGTASDAQIPHLNTLSTGLTPSRCVETNPTTGQLTVAAGPCGAAAGFVDVSGTPTAGQLALFVDPNTVQGSNTLDINYAASHVSTNGTISTGTEYVTTGAGTVTRTLPPAASGTSTKRFYVIKEDAGVGTVSIPPAGGNTISFAGGTGTLTITQQWTGWVLHEVSATGWYAEPLGGGSGSGITDGDKGDITVSSSGTVLMIDPGVVTYAKMQQVSATDRLLGRDTTGAGVVEEITPANVKVMLGLDQVTNTPDSTKPIDLTTNPMTGSVAEFNAALEGADFVTLAGAEDLSGKRVALRYLELSAASGTVAAPIATVAGGDIYYRYGITGALIIPVPTGTPNNGQKLLFILQSDSIQTVTFTPGAGGFSGDANQAVPTSTTGDVGGTNVYDHFTFIYNSHADRYVYVGGSRATSPCPVSAGCTGLSSGTSGGVPYFASATTMASSGVLTANLPVIGGGAGVAPGVGTRSGDTTEFATSTGTKTTNKQLAFDANGNVVASASDIGAGGGGGTGHKDLWPGPVTLPDGTTSNGFAQAQVAKSTGSPPTNAPNLHFTELLFDGATDEHVLFCFAIPSDYASGGTLYSQWKRASGTGAANVVHKGAVAALTPGAGEVPNTKVLSAVATTTTAAGTTAQALIRTTITLNMDSIAARDSVCIMYGRDADNAADTLDAVDIQVLNIWLEYTR